MDVNIKEVVEALRAKPLAQLHEDWITSGVSTDTRTVAKDDLFFALKGARFDAHDFLKEAFEKGARHFVVSDPKRVPAEVKKSANILVVQDTLQAYGDLAKFTRQKFRIPAVAVTGSSGKTTVKELTAHILSQRFKVLKNRGTENNLVGVPKTLLGLDPSHEVMVLEMGTNRPGEIDRLSSIIAPQIGVVTQIGRAHLEGLGSQEGIRKEKLSVLNHIERGGALITNGQDPLMGDVKSGVHRILPVGFLKETCALAAEQAWCRESGISFALSGEIYESPLLGRHNTLNALFAIQTAFLLGLGPDEIRKGLSTFKPVAGRLSMREIEGIFFIDDTYNANPDSYKAAFETLKEFKLRERKGIVCGDMFELGPGSEKLHRELGALAAEMLFDFVIAAGPQMKFFAQEAVKRGLEPKRVHHVKDALAAGKLCREIVTAGDRVLVKGSRGMQMERIFDCFITSYTR